MKSISLSHFLCFFFFITKAQEPQDTTYYLNNPTISKAAKDFYKNKYKADDDTRTLSILDSLKTHDNSTRPFYIYLVSTMMKKSDGALSEALGVASKNFIEQHPNEAIEFLYSSKSMARPEFIDSWAKTLAGEFMIACEGKEIQCIKVSLNKASLKCKDTNRTHLQDLFKRTGTFVKNLVGN
jgi:hypothetical protein